MNQHVKSKREFPYVTLILIVTIVLVVAILGYTFVDSVGIISRMDNAAKSNNIKINEQELDVYRFHVAQNQYYTEFMYYQYGLMQDTYGITSLFSSGAEYANYMIPSTVGSDSFDASAYAYAEQYLAYCEGAKDAQLYDEYKAKVASDIDDYIESLKETAKVNGVSFSNYLKKWIGKGMTEQAVRTAMEYYLIAGEYAEKLHDDYSAALSMEDIEKYREENKGSFYSTAYTSYKLVNNDLKDKIEACTTAKDVEIAIINYYVDLKFKDLYKTNITDKSIEADEAQTKADVLTTVLAMNSLPEKDAKLVFSATDTDTYKKAAYTICSNINTTAKTELNKVAESSSTWSDPTAENATDLVKWLFGEGRKAGDTKLISTTTTSKDSTTGENVTTTSYTWYVVDEVMKLDREHTKDAYYVFVTSDTDGMSAEEKAEAFASELKTAPTPEKFAELTKKYAPGYTAEVTERISHDSMASNSPEFADWLYAEGRAKGDITTVKVTDSTNSTKVTGYVVAMFEKSNEETWELTARDALAEKQLNAWFEDAVKKYSVEIDYEPETTATTAAQ